MNAIEITNDSESWRNVHIFQNDSSFYYALDGPISFGNSLKILLVRQCLANSLRARQSDWSSIAFREHIVRWPFKC